MDSAYNWWDSLNKDMADLGCYCSQADPSVCSRHVNGEVTITSTYTDNMTRVSSSTEEADRAKEELERTYEMKDLGKAGLVLGIKIERNRKAGMLSISQRAYLEWVLEKYGMADCAPKTNLLPLSISLNKAQVPTTSKEHHFMADKLYCKVLGLIMYAQVTTCPDLFYMVSTLSKYSSNPSKPHWNALMHVLWYIKGMLHYKITYGGKDHINLAPVGYVNADYAGDIDT